jgi:hypothetical protein
MDYQNISPKPWARDRNMINDYNGKRIADVSYKQDGHVRANSGVIVKAPELLDGIIALYKWHKCYDGQLDHCAPADMAEQILHEMGLKEEIDAELGRKA